MSVASRGVVVCCILGLFGWLFRDALFHDRNFTYRDAGQFYYPIFKVVSDQWESGRWPLWNPLENGGSPLLANPTSSVLYPLRIVIFQWLPISYGSAFKWYVFLHVGLAAGFAYWLARHSGCSDVASGVAAVSYGFGAIVVFQYCNVIFLVAAAWVPLGMIATDHAFRLGSWTWTAVFGCVLALQTLGGDPETAYVAGLLAALYAVVLDPPLLIGLLAFFAGFAALRAEPEKAGLLAGVAGLVAPHLLRRRASTPSGSQSSLTASPDVPTSHSRSMCVARLAFAATIAFGVSAAQLLPAVEFGRLSLRASPESNHDPYLFCMPPWRVAEFVWPGAMGRQFPNHSRWMDVPVREATLAVRRAGVELQRRFPRLASQHSDWVRGLLDFEFDDRLWEPSLYAGAVPFALACAAWRVRRVAAWWKWLSLVAALSLWAALGRWGGLYWCMVQVLPGFAAFRYPSKLLTFTAVAIAGLAALGWDHWSAGTGRRERRWIIGFAASGLALFLLAWVARPALINWWQASPLATRAGIYGPLLPDVAWRNLCIGFGQSTAVLGAVLALAGGARLPAVARRPRLARAWPLAALAVVAVDVAAANHWLISCDDETQLDAEPTLVKLLREAESMEPTPGLDSTGAPIRIHRTSVFSPLHWAETHEPAREQAVFRWEKNTIQPKYGQPFDVSYVIHEGTMELYDYWWFFAPFYANETTVPRSIVYFPRRGYDMWGAKYFLLPALRDDRDEHRGIRTMQPRTRPVARSDAEHDDYQLLRNEDFYPRAWVVHRLIAHPPIYGMGRAARNDLMRQILYPGGDGLWRESALDGRVRDPRREAWIEHADPAFVATLQPDAPGEPTSTCRFTRYDPDLLELDVETTARGVLVLAEPYYPGWKAWLDARPTDILRTNRMMRGIAVEPGKHHVVLRYKPTSFRIGWLITVTSLAALMLTGVWRGLRSWGSLRRSNGRMPC